MADIVAVLREYADPDFTLSVPNFAKRAMLDAANEIAGLRGATNVASRGVEHASWCMTGKGCNCNPACTDSGRES